MRIALPIDGEMLNQHFGQSRKFLFVAVNPETKEILSTEEKNAPEALHGAIVPWLEAEGTTHVIAGGMGSHMQQTLAGMSIAVMTGAPAGKAVELVRQVLDGIVKPAPSSCACSCSCSH